MAKLPEQPFLTADFSPTGGGIDFLGMRWVNLTLLAEQLIPGINNQTRDFGVYCLAAWIPWKFQQLCASQKDFVLSNFRLFEERIGVAVSHTLRPESPSVAKFGEAHGKIGVQQKLELPGELTFERADRTRSTSIYAAPLYGPSLRFLDLLSYAKAKDQSSLEIPFTLEDAGTTLLAETVEHALGRSRFFEKLNRLQTSRFDANEIDDLGMQGLNPAYYRNSSKRVKRAFLKKLIPVDEPNGRTMTARLLVQTLRKKSGLDLDEIRAVWHTGLFADGSKFTLASEHLSKHREMWAIFQSRQYQRYVIELLMKCFEFALLNGLSSIDAITEHALRQVTKLDARPTTFRDCLMSEAKVVSRATQFRAVSARWNEIVHGNHPAYIWITPDDEPDDCHRALKMLARWYLRTLTWRDREEWAEVLRLGREERMSINWFFDWVSQRLDQGIESFVKDAFEQLVFGQHIRVALSRFDGKNQRLRFVLGDEGIIPTRSAANKLTESLPGWTADRLTSFSQLLCDLSILDEQSDGALSVGELAEILD